MYQFKLNFLILIPGITKFNPLFYFSDQFTDDIKVSIFEMFKINYFTIYH